MSRRWLLILFLAMVCLICATATAQGPCPTGTASDKLVCLLPDIFGINGLQVAVGSHQGHFESSFLSNSVKPLDSAIAREAALLPLASPSSGITFSWDPAAKVFIPSTDSLGPILGDRAETIGKYKVFLGFDYQYFNFGTIDGVDLRNLPVVFTHQDDADDALTPGSSTCSVNAPAGFSSDTNQCSFVRDVVKTNTSIDLKIHQFMTFFTFGLTDRIDVSVAMPIEEVRLGASSTATIVHNGSPSIIDHTFPTRPNCNYPCFVNSFSSISSASGIGDITLRVKGTAWKGERAGLAVGVDVRVPTGDQLNFLGAGAAGVKPFFILSYRGRVSPHANVGYEANGSSVIAGEISTGTKDKLASQLTYSVGADAWITKWLTAAADIVGAQVFQARRTSVTTFTELGACPDDACTNPPAQGNTDPDLSQRTASYNATNISVGGKIRAVKGLVFTGNVLIKLNDGGLRAKYVPLVGLSYTF